MIIKYFKYKISELIFAGVTWCIITSPFWADIISYLWYVLFRTNISDVLYFLLCIGLIPLAHVTWMIFFTSFFLKKYQKVIVIVFSAEAIIFEIVFIYFLIVDPSNIATRIPLTSVEWTPFILFYLFVSILLFLLTGLTFSLQCFKSDNAETRLKGYFLIIAFLSFIVGVIIEIIPIFFEFKYVLSRIIILSAAIEFYIGFILPDWIKKIFLK
jgi:hypothetical protein